ncbi:MAG TPA: hypothetical protein VF982_02760 [Anaerolineales bacterium]
MAANTSGMRMNLSEGSTLGGLLERIALVLLVTAVAGLLFLLLLSVDLQVPREWFKYVLVAALGLAAGCSARFLLAGHNFYLKLFSGLLALLIALAMLNVASRGFIGLDLLRLYPATSTWDGGLSFAISAAVAWLTLKAWTRPRRVLVEPRPAATPLPEPIPQRASQPSGRHVSTRRSTPSLIDSFNAWRTRAAAQLARLAPAPGRGPTTRSRRASKLRPSPRLARRSTAVHLSGITEHVCPYCLEPVVKNDRRGVKICKVCKTWHHGDCWAITGVCQVPHQYAN